MTKITGTYILKGEVFEHTVDVPNDVEAKRFAEELLTNDEQLLRARTIAEINFNMVKKQIFDDYPLGAEIKSLGVVGPSGSIGSLSTNKYNNVITALPSKQWDEACSLLNMLLRGERMSPANLFNVQQIIASITLDVSKYWRHVKSCDVYHVVGSKFRESDMSIDICYRPLTGYLVEFSRPVDGFLEKFEPVQKADVWVTVEK